MRLSAAERRDRIERYARGPALLRAAFDAVPPEARTWRPGAGRWSAHEIVCHCADAETGAALRIRCLVAEPEPLVVGYDEAEWARVFDYHGLSAESALAVVEAVRAHTAALLRRLPDAAWEREGRHTHAGRYTACDWLETLSEHLEKHSGQIERGLAAWRESRERA